MSNDLIWIKSSYSGSEGGQCIEIATLPDGGHAVRDSKDPAGPVLRLSAEAWSTLIRDVKAGRLD
jgi:uncharacterized protein DUF397